MKKQSAMKKLVPVGQYELGLLVGAIIQINAPIGLTDKASISGDGLPLFDREAEQIPGSSDLLYQVDCLADSTTGIYAQVTELFSANAPLSFEFGIGVAGRYKTGQDRYIIKIDELKMYQGDQ